MKLSRNKIEADQDYETLLNYIERESADPDACLILSVCSSSIDEKNNIFKALKEKAKVVQIVDPDERGWHEYVKAYLQKHNIVIDKDAIMELTERTNGDVGLFQNSRPFQYY